MSSSVSRGILGLCALLASLAPAVTIAASGTLVLYTSQPNKDAQQTVDAFKQRHPEVEVEWIRDGTTKVMAKLRAELTAGAPKPDVLLIADVVNMEALKQEGHLMAYPQAPVAAYDSALYDAGKTYFSTKLITTGIVYNTGAPMKPEEWSDLVKPEAKGLVAMPSPLTSGAATVHMNTLTSNPGLGWAYYEKLAANGITPKGGNGGTFKAVASGEKLYGMVVDFVPIRAKAQGSPVEFVFPASGVSAVTEPVAILSTAKNVEAAKAFVDFLLSKEGQLLAADQGYLAAHPEVTPPAGFPARDKIKLMPFDAAKALSNADADRKRFVELFGQ
ncbi:MAG: ABC transporter substrate-binding protein [Gammaproteobacteria bacterium]|nr:ABC transporter substrate-binding protein [Gammaproteobacteria bacterium]